MKFTRSTPILSLILLIGAALPAPAQESSAGKPDKQEKQQSTPAAKQKNQPAADPKQQQRAADQQKQQNSANQKQQQRATDNQKQQDTANQKQQQRAADQRKQQDSANQKQQQRATDQRKQQDAANQKQQKNQADQQQRAADQRKQKDTADQKQQKSSPDQQQKHEADKPAATAAAQTKPAQKFTPQPLPNHTPEQTRQWVEKKAWTNNGGWQGHNSWREHRSDNWGRDHRSWAQRGGYGGYYIPQDYYVMYFGPVHYFRFQQAPVIYWGYPRFYYQDVSFIMVDPWPMSWQENWYESDDVYIEYNDGYYLYNRREPTFAIAINIVID